MEFMALFFEICLGLDAVVFGGVERHLDEGDGVNRHRFYQLVCGPEVAIETLDILGSIGLDPDLYVREAGCRPGRVGR